jgi:hypothetical protein
MKEPVGNVISPADKVSPVLSVITGKPSNSREDSTAWE